MLLQIIVLSLYTVALGADTDVPKGHVFITEEVPSLRDRFYSDGLLENGTTRNEIGCSRSCMHTNGCLTFLYKKDTNECHLYGEELNTTNHQYTVSPGYRHYKTKGNTNPCMNGGSCVDEVNEDTCSSEYDGPRSEAGPYIDCYDALLDGQTVSGVYNVYFANVIKAVYCDQDTDGGGWLVLQRRRDGCVDFYRGWNDYADGFGDITGEFWIGNDFLADLTAQKSYKLRVDMESFENETRFAQYGIFSVGPASTNYALSVGGYSGTAGDSLASSNGYEFSTKDRDNDVSSSNCAVASRGAWWYWHCRHSNLNGFYYGGVHSSIYDGVNWYHWLGYYYSLRKTEMKCRPN